jgi:hypothetical protein
MDVAVADARGFNIEEELSRRVNSGDDLMGHEDPEWVTDETGSEPIALRPQFDYERIIEAQRDGLATRPAHIIHSEYRHFLRASTGYIGQDTIPAADIPMTIPALGDIVGRRFGGQVMELVEWDGRSALPIVSDDDKVIGIGVPRLPGRDWDDISRRASMKIFDVQKSYSFGNSDNRRGRFSSIDFGSLPLRPQLSANDAPNGHYPGRPAFPSSRAQGAHASPPYRWITVSKPSGTTPPTTRTVSRHRESGPPSLRTPSQPRRHSLSRTTSLTGSILLPTHTPPVSTVKWVVASLPRLMMRPGPVSLQSLCFVGNTHSDRLSAGNDEIESQL